MADLPPARFGELPEIPGSGGMNAALSCGVPDGRLAAMFGVDAPMEGEVARRAVAVAREAGLDSRIPDMFSSFSAAPAMARGREGELSHRSGAIVAQTRLSVPITSLQIIVYTESSKVIRSPVYFFSGLAKLAGFGTRSLGVTITTTEPPTSAAASRRYDCTLDTR